MQRGSSVRLFFVLSFHLDNLGFHRFLNLFLSAFILSGDYGKSKHSYWLDSIQIFYVYETFFDQNNKYLEFLLFVSDRIKKNLTPLSLFGRWFARVHLQMHLRDPNISDISETLSNFGGYL